MDDTQQSHVLLDKLHMFTTYCSEIYHPPSPPKKKHRAGAMNFTIKVEYFVDIRIMHLVFITFV